MRRVERGGDLAEDVQRRLGLEPLRLLEPRLQVDTLDVAHDDEQDAVGFSGLVDRDDVRVIDRRRQMGLALEPLAEARVVRELRRQDLERHVTLETRLHGAVDDAHAAPPDQPLDPVTGEFRADPRVGVDTHGIVTFYHAPARVGRSGSDGCVRSRLATAAGATRRPPRRRPGPAYALPEAAVARRSRRRSYPSRRPVRTPGAPRRERSCRSCPFPLRKPHRISPLRRGGGGDMWLTIRSREGDTRSLEIAKERLVIGREEGCDLLLEDDKVSREHAALSVNPEGHIIVEDLRSTNGTYVNGRRITEPTHLGPDDELRIGESQINASATEPGTGAPRTMLAGPGMTVQQGAQSAPPSAPSPVVPPPPPQSRPLSTRLLPRRLLLRRPPLLPRSARPRQPLHPRGLLRPVPYRAHHAAQVGQAGPDHRGDRGCRSAHRHPRRRALRHRRDRRRGGGGGTTADRLRDHRLGEALDGADPRYR